MKICKKCNKKSITQNLMWENGRFVLKKQCCNPKCGSYKPYSFWQWKQNSCLMEVKEMKKWLMKQFGIIKKRNAAELEIITRLNNTCLTRDEKDCIVDIVKEALDRQFK